MWYSRKESLMKRALGATAVCRLLSIGPKLGVLALLTVTLIAAGAGIAAAGSMRTQKRVYSAFTASDKPPAPVRPGEALAADTIRVYENPAVIQSLTLRPSRLTLAADGNYTITGLRYWNGWGTSVAQAN
jgi:hypothetical protein